MDILKPGGEVSGRRHTLKLSAVRAHDKELFLWPSKFVDFYTIPIKSLDRKFKTILLSISFKSKNLLESQSRLRRTSEKMQLNVDGASYLNE